MSGEYWAGWFDHWGRAHANTNLTQQTRELEWMIGRGYSVNLYMFHGGTTFGFMNGANIDRTRYVPDTTSYDYDAALDESGRLTPKYFAFRDVIAAHTTAPLPPIPASDAPIAIPAFSLKRAASIWDLLGCGVHVDRPRPMETFGQSYGYILYRTTVAAPGRGDLVVSDVRDYAQVYVDGRLAGTLDRRLDQNTLSVDIPRAGAHLDILVENSGRVNFSKPLREERKGITKSVSLGGAELTGWDVFTLPMSTAPPAHGGTNPGSHAGGPAVYRGAFMLASTGDTFLD